MKQWEKETIQLLKQGLKDKEIALQCHRSPGAIRARLDKLFKLLNTKRREEIILMPWTEIELRLDTVYKKKISKRVYKKFNPDIINRNLTERELQVLNLLCRNFSIKEMCNNLGIGSQTVKYHCTNIYKKLNAKNKTDVVIMKMQGMI